MKQFSLSQARAKLSTLVAEVDKGKGPIAIAQRSKVKAILVDPEWHGRVEEVEKGKGPIAIAQRSKVKAILVDPESHGRVEEELAHYRKIAKRAPLKLRGSMTLAEPYGGAVWGQTSNY